MIYLILLVFYLFLLINLHNFVGAYTVEVYNTTQQYTPYSTYETQEVPSKASQDFVVIVLKRVLVFFVQAFPSDTFFLGFFVQLRQYFTPSIPLILETLAIV